MYRMRNRAHRNTYGKPNSMGSVYCSLDMGVIISAPLTSRVRNRSRARAGVYRQWNISRSRQPAHARNTTMWTHWRNRRPLNTEIPNRAFRQ